MDTIKSVLALILLLGLGIMMIIKPELLWKIEHIFTVKNGEPTELYLALMRISGVIFTVVSIFSALVFLFYK